ncbi:MAG TPA: transglycosylase domain-containing protein [Actinomycetota bacterium]|nr:transglycosylase domain-containing protein [Actinomycetota bacterium]
MTEDNKQSEQIIGSGVRDVARSPYVRWLSLLASLVLAFIAADEMVEYALAQIPLPREVKLPSSARVYDRNGELIATFRDEVTRYIINSKTLPPHVRRAVVAAEDRDFYEHEGVSIKDTARAAWKNLTNTGVLQGGSTITQQYVKNAVLEDPSRTIERKFKELILSVKVERRYSKTRILDMYLNTVYFGRGAYGIEAASRVYFAKHASQLTLSEAAYLAGLIPAPADYEGRRAGMERRSYVLKGMRDEGYITAREMRRADRTRLKLRTHETLRRGHQEAAYFLEWLRKDYLYPRFGDCLYRCGLKIHTTLDLGMQSEAEEAIDSILTEPSDPQAALVSMTPDGEVRAMVGGRDFTEVKRARGFNYATDGKRQAGSAFKPFTLLSAIEQDISTSSRFSGESPKTIEDPACTGPDGVWMPENYGGSSFPTLDLTSATANSVNTIYAELVSEVGPENVAEVVESFGFTGSARSGEVEPVCSLSLGTLDVSVLEMTRAFAGFAARGNLPEPVPIRFVTDRSDECILGFRTGDDMKCRKRDEIAPRRAAEANDVDVLNQALQSVVEGGTATAAQIGRPVAGKTGTTQDNRDAWFAGYTPQLATVVWMGYPIEAGPDKKFGTPDDVSPLMHYCSDPAACRPVHGIEVTGGSFPATIWGLYMQAALVDTPIESFTVPVDLPDVVLNPPPPPKPERDKGRKGWKWDDDDDHDDDPGNGNAYGRDDD